MNTLCIDLHTTTMMIMQFGNNDMVVHTQLANMFDLVPRKLLLLFACASSLQATVLNLLQYNVNIGL